MKNSNLVESLKKLKDTQILDVLSILGYRVYGGSRVIREDGDGGVERFLNLTKKDNQEEVERIINKELKRR